MLLRVLLLLLVLVAGALLGLGLGWIRVPPEWNPWAPLDVAAPPNGLTSFKLMRLQGNRSLCEQALATSGMDYSLLPDSTPAPGCPLENVVLVRRSEVSFNGRFTVTCPLAVAFALFERHHLQPIAEKIFGQPVTRVDHLGSFACRNIYNLQNGRRSEHARANALDVAGFRLADGRRIDVGRNWKGNDDKALFLHEVRDGACQVFNTTLSPEYNQAHANHLHLDMGGFRACR